MDPKFEGANVANPDHSYSYLTRLASFANETRVQVCMDRSMRAVYAVPIVREDPDCLQFNHSSRLNKSQTFCRLAASSWEPKIKKQKKKCV